MRRNLNIKQRKWRSLIFATIFGVTAATAVITVKPLESYAYTETAGVLNDGPVQMRKAPVDGDKITSLAAGTAVRVIDEVDGTRYRFPIMEWHPPDISGQILSRCQRKILLPEARSQTVQHRERPEWSRTPMATFT